MTLDRFADTVSLITGSSRGIGFAIARRIVAEGGRGQVERDAARTAIDSGALAEHRVAERVAL